MKEKRPVPEDHEYKRDDDIGRLRPHRDRSQGQVNGRETDSGIAEDLIEDVERLAIDRAVERKRRLVSPFFILIVIG